MDRTASWLSVTSFRLALCLYRSCLRLLSILADAPEQRRNKFFPSRWPPRAEMGAQLLPAPVPHGCRKCICTFPFPRLHQECERTDLEAELQLLRGRAWQQHGHGNGEWHPAAAAAAAPPVLPLSGRRLLPHADHEVGFGVTDVKQALHDMGEALRSQVGPGLACVALGSGRTVGYQAGEASPRSARGDQHVQLYNERHITRCPVTAALTPMATTVQRFGTASDGAECECAPSPIIGW